MYRGSSRFESLSQIEAPRGERGREGGGEEEEGEGGGGGDDRLRSLERLDGVSSERERSDSCSSLDRTQHPRNVSSSILNYNTMQNVLQSYKM